MLWVEALVPENVLEKRNRGCQKKMEVVR